MAGFDFCYDNTSAKCRKWTFLAFILLSLFVSVVIPTILLMIIDTKGIGPSDLKSLEDSKETQKVLILCLAAIAVANDIFGLIAVFKRNHCLAFVYAFNAFVVFIFNAIAARLLSPAYWLPFLISIPLYVQSYTFAKDVQRIKNL